MHTSRVQQFYGYSVCLIAIVVGIFAVGNFVDAVFARAQPLHARGHPYGDGRSLASFEAYSAANPPAPPRRPGAPEATPADDTVSEARARARYEALRTDHIAAVRYQTTKDMVSSVLMLLIAAALFATHWRWLRRPEPDVDSAAG